MSLTIYPPRDGEVDHAPHGKGAPPRATALVESPLRPAFGAPPSRPEGDFKTIPLRFQLGARTLIGIPRRLRRVALSLDDALGQRLPVLATPGAGGDGYLVTSLPETVLSHLDTGSLIVRARQRYERHYVDLAAGEAAWRSGLSANARAQIKRKAKKLGAYQVRRFRTADEIAAFHPLARAVSALTYQERLLDSGLPADPAALLRLAAADGVRAWLLCVDDAPIAYLCCTADGETLRYDHVGHDPAFGGLSPGAVLQAEALSDLFGEGRWARFDFTEGEGQHKRQCATGSVACVDVLLLRATLANRVLVAALQGWDGAVALGKKWVPALKKLGR